ncbi:hypothetical protein Peur_061120 [Populus x canadensis]
MSPVGKLWEGITLKSGSSEKRVSSIPDLPCISEENENTKEVPETFQDGNGSEQMNLASMIRVEGTKLMQENQKGNRRKCNSKAKENQSILGANDFERAKESHDNRFNKPILFGKTSLRKGDSGLAGMKLKHNNIVSNITSFIPLVHQKQAAAVVTGKRDVKVKALEAAEVAKRLTRKKMNERRGK